MKAFIQNSSNGIVVEGQNMGNLEVESTFSKEKITVNQEPDRSDAAHIYSFNSEQI